jgi:hypothetical protein
VAPKFAEWHTPQSLTYPGDTVNAHHSARGVVPIPDIVQQWKRLVITHLETALVTESDRNVVAIRLKPTPDDDQSLESVFESELYLALG